MHFCAGFLVLLLLYAHYTTGRAVVNSDNTHYATQQASYDEYRDKYPFLVSIGRKGNKLGSFTYRQGHFCGGALITRDRVLTAAHCLIGEKMKDLRVIVGMAEFSKATVIYNVSDWKTYNEWDGKLDSDYHDIAVIELTECVRERNIRTINLYPKYLDRDAFQLETAGWGKTEKYKTSPVLLKIDLRLVPLKACEADLTRETSKTYSIAMQHMCTRSDHKMHLGEGDSGGPLILRENGVPYIVAVNEAYCAESTSFLNIHSRISYYKQFIREATKSRRCCTFM